MTKLIQPNCRVQFAAEDVEFIVEVLGKRLGTRECLVQLLADQQSRDLILDDEQLRRTLLESGGCLRVSSRFYFYVLVRYALRQAGLEERALADYVAEVLAEFTLSERARCSAPGEQNSLEYMFEMLAALQSADDRTAFSLRAHIGNYSLFLTGVFPDRIKARSESRGFPDLRYYERLGRTQFLVASDHRLALRFDLAEIFSTLGERFAATRRALNDMADRLLCLGDSNSVVEALLIKGRN